MVGTTLGLASVGINISSMEVNLSRGHGFIANREMVETALKNEGLTLQSIKCSLMYRRADMAQVECQS